VGLARCAGARSLLDASSSMNEILSTAQAAAIGFVRTARDGDRVSVIERSAAD
jgi:hypothetical protein